MFRFIVALMLLFPLAVQAQDTQTQDRIKPGQWKQTIHVKIPGSSAKVPTHSSTSCVKPGKAASIKSIIEQAKQPGCKLDDYSRSGNKVHWKMTCTGKSQASTEGVFTLQSKTAYHIQMKAFMQTPKGRYQTLVDSDGKWVGACQ